MRNWVVLWLHKNTAKDGVSINAEEGWLEMTEVIDC